MPSTNRNAYFTPCVRAVKCEPSIIKTMEKQSLVLVDEEYLNPNEDEAMDTTRDIRLRQCQ